MSNIEWTDATWNPVIGCAKVAQGCKHCYAEKMSKRLAAMGSGEYHKVISNGVFNGRALPLPFRLDEPLRWKKPRMVFVNSMSDLFHPDVPFEFIAAVYGVMAACPRHTFQVLTKRPERMREFFEWVERHELCVESEAQYGFIDGVNAVSDVMIRHFFKSQPGLGRINFEVEPPEWPLHNVWHGVSIANQPDADKNIVELLRVPSAIRFVSAEPLIEAVDLSHPNKALPIYREAETVTVHAVDGTPSGPHNTHKRPGRGYGRYTGRGVDWVIVGGESGPGARPFDIAWARSIIQQCKAAGVPVFVKQLGSLPLVFDSSYAWGGTNISPHDGPGGEDDYTYWRVHLADRKGGDPEEWPADLRVREFPKAVTA